MGSLGGGGSAVAGSRRWVASVPRQEFTVHVLLAHEICDESGGRAQSTHFTWGSAARTGESGHYFYEPHGLRHDLGQVAFFCVVAIVEGERW